MELSTEKSPSNKKNHRALNVTKCAYSHNEMNYAWFSSKPIKV